MEVRLPITERFGDLPDEEKIDRTAEALNKKGFKTFVVANAEDAKRQALDPIPEGAEIMDMTSATLRALSVSEEVNSSGRYDSVRNKLTKMSRATQSHEMQQLGAAPEWVIGSVHALTEDGRFLIASNTGSQLPAYAYGSSHVIWVIGAQKIAKDVNEGIQRLYEYSLPMEDARAMKAYGVGSNVNKILIVNNENRAGRITVIIVKQKLGF